MAKSKEMEGSVCGGGHRAMARRAPPPRAAGARRAARARGRAKGVTGGWAAPGPAAVALGAGAAVTARVGRADPRLAPCLFAEICASRASPSPSLPHTVNSRQRRVSGAGPQIGSAQERPGLSRVHPAAGPLRLGLSRAALSVLTCGPREPGWARRARRCGKAGTASRRARGNLPVDNLMKSCLYNLH